MFKIPNVYRDSNENYITIPVIRKFVKKYNISQISKSREELLNEVEGFANTNDENIEIVLNWLDEILQEGIREIHLFSLKPKSTVKKLLSSIESIQNYIATFIDKSVSRHFCGNEYDDHFKLINFNILKYNNDVKITFMFCKKLISYDAKQHLKKIIEYPVVAEYYINSEWLIIKAKPKSNLYKYEKEFNIENAESTKYEKQIDEVYEILKHILDYEHGDKVKTMNVLKNKIFELVEKFTDTPQPIKQKLDESMLYIEKMAEQVQCIADVPKSKYQDIKIDITNIIEKYISIFWKNKLDFTQDRDAYPIKLCATDDEESKVEQEAAASEPLQMKAIFFDNKKMLYNNNKCDGVVFCWKRIDDKYYSDTEFKVSFIVSSKGKCIIKFPIYTEMEDMNRVLFSIINIR